MSDQGWHSVPLWGSTAFSWLRGTAPSWKQLPQRLGFWTTFLSTLSGSGNMSSWQAWNQRYRDWTYVPIFQDLHCLPCMWFHPLVGFGSEVYSRLFLQKRSKFLQQKSQVKYGKAVLLAITEYHWYLYCAWDIFIYILHPIEGRPFPFRWRRWLWLPGLLHSIQGSATKLAPFESSSLLGVSTFVALFFALWCLKYPRNFVRGDNQWHHTIRGFLYIFVVSIFLPA